MLRHKSRVRLLRRVLVALVVLVPVGLIAWPLSLELWEALTGPTAPTADLTWQDVTRRRTLEILAAGWCFWFGASVGSFLNVVVYRLPRRISLVWRPSNCPYCRTPIQPRDNIPVLGWLLLSGRCRACRLPISPRYPLVELATGATFLLLYFVELVSGGANLPLREPALHRGVAAMVFDPHWDLVGLYAYHMLLLCTLLTWGLIRHDGFRIPPGYALFTLATGSLAAALWPPLQPVSWLVAGPNATQVGTELADFARSLPAWLARLDTSLAGLLAGALLGSLIQAAWRRRSLDDDLPQACLGLATVGLFLGWQSAVSAGLLTGLLLTVHEALAMARPPRPLARCLPWLGMLALATTLHLVLWRPLAQLPWWPGPHSSWLTIAAAVTVTGVLHWIAKGLRTLRCVSGPSSSDSADQKRPGESAADGPQTADNCLPDGCLTDADSPDRCLTDADSPDLDSPDQDSPDQDSPDQDSPDGGLPDGGLPDGAESPATSDLSSDREGDVPDRLPLPPAQH